MVATCRSQCRWCVWNCPKVIFSQVFHYWLCRQCSSFAGWYLPLQDSVVSYLVSGACRYKLRTNVMRAVFSPLSDIQTLVSYGMHYAIILAILTKACLFECLLFSGTARDMFIYDLTQLLRLWVPNERCMVAGLLGRWSPLLTWLSIIRSVKFIYVPIWWKLWPWCWIVL